MLCCSFNVYFPFNNFHRRSMFFSARTNFILVYSTSHLLCRLPTTFIFISDPGWISGIPTRGSYTRSNIGKGIHKIREYLYHCDTGAEYPIMLLPLSYRDSWQHWRVGLKIWGEGAGGWFQSTHEYKLPNLFLIPTKIARISVEFDRNFPDFSRFNFFWGVAAPCSPPASYAYGWQGRVWLVCIYDSNTYELVRLNELKFCSMSLDIEIILNLQSSNSNIE